MKHAVTEQPTGWDALEAGEKAVRLHRARQAWLEVEREAGVTWPDLSPSQQRFAAMMLPMVQQPEMDHRGDTVSCPECFDRLLVPGAKARIRIFSPHRREAVDAVWFCQTCDNGLRAESGWWLQHRTPREGKRRVKSVRGWSDWGEFEKSDSFRAHRIEAEIAALLRQEHTKREENDDA